MILAWCKNTSESYTGHNPLFSAAEEDGDIGIKEEVLAFNQVHEVYVAEVVFLGYTHFDGGDGLDAAASLVEDLAGRTAAVT